MFEDSNISLLSGKVITRIEYAENCSYEVEFTCSDGEKFRLYHMQDCCEHVRVFKVDGNVNSVLNSRVLSATKTDSVEGMGITYQPYDSYTWSVFTIITAKGYLRIIWLGESNGYYSEKVHFQRAH